MHEWRDHDLLRRALAIFGLESLGELLRRRTRYGCWPGSARLHVPPATGARPTGFVPRSRRPAGSFATFRVTAASSSSPGRDRRPRLRPPRGAGGCCAAAGEALEIWATERAVASEPWLAESRGPRPRQARTRADGAGGTRDHQGVVARARAVPLRGRAGSSPPPSRRCSSASTASAIPATWAPSAGAPRERARRASSSRSTGRRV